MSDIRDLQSFSFEELYHYDEDDSYMFIFVTREGLEQLAEGYLATQEFIEAVDDTRDWLKFRRDMLIEQGRVFIAIFQRKTLEEAGFLEPSYVMTRDEEDWDKKVDDNILELRAKSPVKISPIGYSSMFQSGGKRDEDGRVSLLSGYGQHHRHF